MADDKRYTLISAGAIVDGFEHQTVVANLQKALSIDESKALGLLREQRVIKNRLSQERALHFQKQFQQLGLLVHISDRQAARSGDTAKVQGEALPLDQLFSEPFPHIEPNEAALTRIKRGTLLALTGPILYGTGIFLLLVVIVSFLLSLAPLFVVVDGFIGRLIVAGLPLLLLAVPLAILMKPLLVRSKRWRGYRVRQEEFPQLYRLVDQLARHIGAPIPKAIYVDNGTDVTIRPIGGSKGVETESLYLTIGLPLLAATESRDLLTLLAHELGHYIDPVRARAYSRILQLNQWLDSSATDSDPVDAALERLAKRFERVSPLQKTVSLLQQGVAVGRQLLALLGQLNRSLTAEMVRQCEHDADSVATRLAGSGQLRTASMQQRRLTHVREQVAQLNRDAYSGRRLLNNIPEAVVVMAGRLTAEDEAVIEAGLDDHESQPWGYHPADNERLLVAERRDDTGQLAAAFRSRELVDNFTRLAKRVTLEQYRVDGIEEPERLVVKNREVMEFEEEREERNKALNDYYNGSFVMRFHTMQESDNPAWRDGDIDQTIIELRKHLVDYRNQQEELLFSEERITRMMIGRHYLAAGIKVDYHNYGLTGGGARDAKGVIAKTQEGIAKIEAFILSIDRLFYHRMVKGLELMEGNSASESLLLLKTVQKISRHGDKLQQLARVRNIIEEMIDEPDSGRRKALKPTIDRYVDFCRQDGVRLVNQLDTIPDGLGKEKNLKEFVLNWTGNIYQELDSGDPKRLVNGLRHLDEAMRHQYYWSLARLCEFLQQAERDNGVTQMKLINLKQE